MIAKILHCPLLLLALLLAGAACLAAGCGGGQPGAQSIFYSLDYAAPRAEAPRTLDLALRVSRFSAAPGFNSTEMFYGPDRLSLTAYNYDRWLVPPGDMVSDFLARDLRDSGRFKVVFTYHEPQATRFVLQGGVRRFQELDQGGGASALLEISATLLDTRETDVTKRVLFQRRYQASAAMAAKNARGLAEAMGKAMAEISAKITAEVYAALQ